MSQAPGTQTSPPSTGSLAYGCHEGGRSEPLVEFALGAFGTVVCVPREEDCGYDMHCGLGERVGRRLYIRDHYYVQVKSRKDDLIYPDPDSVRWLTSLACPLFIAVADKATGVIELYQTLEIAALDETICHVRLTFDEGPQFAPRERNLTEAVVHLGKPILRFTGVEAQQEPNRDRLARALGFWIQHGREHIEERRAGALAFHYPLEYGPNAAPLCAYRVNGTYWLSPKQWDTLHDRMLKCFGTMLLGSANFRPERFEEWLEVIKFLFQGLTSSETWGLRFFTGAIDIACRRMNRPNPWSARSDTRDLRDVVKVESMQVGWSKPAPGPAP